jgi:hypothetical protein
MPGFYRVVPGKQFLQYDKSTLVSFACYSDVRPHYLIPLIKYKLCERGATVISAKKYYFLLLIGRLKFEYVH